MSQIKVYFIHMYFKYQKIVLKIEVLRYSVFLEKSFDIFLTFRYLKQHQHYYKSKKTVIFVLTGHRYQNKYIHQAANFLKSDQRKNVSNWKTWLRLSTLFTTLVTSLQISAQAQCSKIRKKIQKIREMTFQKKNQEILRENALLAISKVISLME